MHYQIGDKFQKDTGRGKFGWFHFYLLKLHVISINKSKMFIVLYHIFTCSTVSFVLWPLLLRIAHQGPIQDNLIVGLCDCKYGWSRGDCLQYLCYFLFSAQWHFNIWWWWYQDTDTDMD